MNPTKKRLKIIKLAISLTDNETIQLQMLKLSMYKTDVKLQEILTALQHESFAHAQELINTYIETPTEEILQRSKQEYEQIQKEKEMAIIEEFDLFFSDDENETEKEEINLDTLLDIKPVKDEKPKTVDFNALLDLKADDILKNNITLNYEPSQAKRDAFFEEKIPSVQNKRTEEDDFFFAIDSSLQTDLPAEENMEILTIPLKEGQTMNITAPLETDSIHNNESIPSTQEDHFFFSLDASSQIDLSTEENPDRLTIVSEEEQTTNIEKPLETDSVTGYKSISYIDQKLANLNTQFPPQEIMIETSALVNQYLNKIKNQGYTDKDIEEIFQAIHQKRQTDKADAAQLLLLAGATESVFAQFMLSRELYKGELLQKNISEAITRIYKLAMDDYPEAICDLAQFYEHGIGKEKDKDHALELYKEAMELGVHRAAKHYERLLKEKKGFLGLF
ncbi:MAG: sel1 repeat family protein [Campylobacterales bacterium]|nr:sel1 repeat family protein [Campylobacterales bacterium]